MDANNYTQEERDLMEEVFLSEREAEQKVIDDLTAERDDYKNKYLYALADLDNAKKRLAAERISLIESGATSVIKEVINIADDFERAIKQNEPVDNVDSLKDSFKLLYDKFIKSLKSVDVEQIQSTGQAFDTDFHEAVASIPAPENMKEEVGFVCDTVRTGYTYKGKVLRHSSVVVYTDN